MLYNKLISFTLALLLQSFTLNTANALICHCNTNNCPNNTCVTADHRDSRCFRSYEFKHDAQEPYLEATSGCFGGSDTSIAPMQCQTDPIKFIRPKQIICCKSADFCNDNSTDAQVSEDDRWNSAVFDQSETPTDGSLTTVHALVAIVVLLICVIVCLITHRTLKSGVEKCPKSAIVATIPSPGTHTSGSGSGTGKSLVSSSSGFTQSCSISYDPCHKTESSLDQKFDGEDSSFSVVDMTSGIGPCLLNERTIARAIGAGKTDPVGDGRFGRVFRGHYHGDDVAVKAFKTIDQESWQREDQIFKYLNHENIVRFIASEYATIDGFSTEIWMFLEFCPLGSLCDYLDRNEIFGTQQAIMILYSIINGLNYLHEDYAKISRQYKPSIAHRDLKSKNILMKSPNTCCIADFGHALIKVNEESVDTGRYKHLQVGTVRYMAPEILKPNENLNYNLFITFAQADLYQFGLVLWEVCYRTALDVMHPAGMHKLPYYGLVPPNPSIQDMIKIVCEDQSRPRNEPHWERFPIMRKLSELMVECWRPNPRARMETLGIKKKLRQLYDNVTTNSPLDFSFELSPFVPSRSKSDRTL